MAYNPAGGTNYVLGASIGSTDNTILLSSFLVPVSGAQITMALMNTSIAFATIAPGTFNSEFISFTGITANSNGTTTLTGVTRGLDRTYPFTSNALFKLPHSGQSIFILSDMPQVFNQYAPLAGGVFSGLVTFAATVPTATTYTPAPAATATLNLALGNRNIVTLPAGNCVLALSNVTASQIFDVEITQDAVGSRTVAWFAGIRWPGGVVPTLSTGATKTDVFTFISLTPTTFLGMTAGQNL